MRLREAFDSPSALDIIYGYNDKGTGEDMKKKSTGSFTKKRQALTAAKKVVDSPSDGVVSSPTLAPITAPPAAPQAPKEKTTMQLTLKGLNAKRTTAIYSGTLGSIRIGLSAFPGKTAPETIEVGGEVFAVKAPKVAKAKLTKEERAALPKPTAAERVAKMEERLAKAKAKLEAANSDI